MTYQIVWQNQLKTNFLILPHEEFSIKPGTAKYMSSSFNSLKSLTRLAIHCRTQFSLSNAFFIKLYNFSIRIWAKSNLPIPNINALTDSLFAKLKIYLNTEFQHAFNSDTWSLDRRTAVIAYCKTGKQKDVRPHNFIKRTSSSQDTIACWIKLTFNNIDTDR